MKKSLKSIILSSLILASIFMFILTGVLYTSANAEGWSEIGEIEAVYNEEFEIPTRTYTADGKTYTSNYVVTLPDGNTVRQDSIVFSDPGIYTIKYTVDEKVNNKWITDTVSLTVYVPAYSFSNSETSVDYGEYVYTDSNGDVVTKVSGLKMSIQPNDSVTSEQVMTIDNEYNGYVKLFSYFINPTKAGEADYLRTNFVLTDVEDPSCTLTISNGRSNSTYFYAVAGSYTMCAGSNSNGTQLLKGREMFGTTEKIHTNNSYGTYTLGGSYYSSYINVKMQSNIPDRNDTRALTYWFNPAENAVYVSIGTSSTKTLVCDLDGSLFYGEATDIKWHGFTSGKVKLTVSPTEFVGTNANIFFTYIKDANIEDQIEIVEDNDGPVIVVDSDEYDSSLNMPDARLGYYYTIPSASAYDSIFGERDVKVTVKLNGKTIESSKIVGDTFLVDKVGNYTIEYTAADPFNNVGSFTLKVHANANIDEIDIQLPAYDDTCTVGLETILPTPILTGGSGKLNLTVKNSYKGRESDIDPDTLAFHPNYDGEYTITYTVTDYTGYSVEKVFTMNVERATKPAYRVDTVSFPPVFINGFTYTLPEVTVYDYTSGSCVEYLSKVLVSYNGSSQDYTSGDTFTPSVLNNGDKIEIQYFSPYGDGEEITLETIEVPVVVAYDENARIQTQNYFYNISPNYTSEKSSDGIKFTVLKNGDCTWTFANYLVVNGFHLVVDTVAGYAVCDDRTVKLTDSENPDGVLEFKIYQSGSKHYIDIETGVKNDEVTLVSKAKTTKTYYSYDIKVINGKVSVNGVSYEIFEGLDDFTSGKATLEFTMHDARGSTEYFINEINSQVFSTISTDKTSPYISESDDYGGAKEKDSTCYIYPKVSADVISPMVNFTMTVYNPNGLIVKDINGTELKDVDPTIGYYVKFDTFGEYVIKYTSVDYKINSKGKLVVNASTNTEDIITIVDNIAPVVNFNSEVAKTVKVGAIITLPTYTVSDNITAKEDISVIATFTNPYGIVKYISGDSFACTNVGVYTLTMAFVDEAGNYYTTSYTIKVTA